MGLDYLWVLLYLQRQAGTGAEMAAKRMPGKHDRPLMLLTVG
jgi:hypothetical protein